MSILIGRIIGERFVAFEKRGDLRLREEGNFKKKKRKSCVTGIFQSHKEKVPALFHCDFDVEVSSSQFSFSFFFE